MTVCGYCGRSYTPGNEICPKCPYCERNALDAYEAERYKQWWDSGGTLTNGPYVPLFDRNRPITNSPCGGK